MRKVDPIQEFIRKTNEQAQRTVERLSKRVTPYDKATNCFTRYWWKRDGRKRWIGVGK